MTAIKLGCNLIDNNLFTDLLLYTTMSLFNHTLPQITDLGAQQLRLGFMAYIKGITGWSE